MIAPEQVQEVNQRAPIPALDHLSTVVAKTEMDCLLSGKRVKDDVNRRGGEGAVLWIARYIRFVNLEAGAFKLLHLCC